MTLLADREWDKPPQRAACFLFSHPTAGTEQRRSLRIRCSIRRLLLPEFGARSRKKEIEGMQCTKLHTREYELIVLIKGDDHVVAALVTMCIQGGEICEEFRDVDEIVMARSTDGEIRNARRTRPVLDAHEIVAAAEEEIAGKGAAFAENERIRAAAQLHVPHDAAVIDDRLVTVTPADGNVHALDQAPIIDNRRQLSIVDTIAINDVQFYRRRAGMIAGDRASALVLDRYIVAGNEHARRSNRAKQIARGGPAINRNLAAIYQLVTVADHNDGSGSVTMCCDGTAVFDQSVGRR